MTSIEQTANHSFVTDGCYPQHLQTNHATETAVMAQEGLSSTARRLVLDIARLNDEAIYKWVLMPDKSSVVEGLLAEALDRVNTLSKDILAWQSCTLSTEGRTTPLLSSSSTFVLPLTVDIKPRTTTTASSYDKAFLLKATVMSDRSPSIVDSVSIVAAVVFYNTALFFHHHIALQVTDDRQSLGANMVMQYYEVANDILGKYLERTRRPLWTLQAAVWYNLADCARFHTITPTSCLYFGQLEAIVGYLTDKDDRTFFDRAMAMARIQMRQCFCAAVA